MRTHGDSTCRHGGPLPNALRRMGQEALEHCGTQARPDQPLRDIRSVELVQVGVRLPLFETQFNLSPEPIEPRDQVQRERRAVGNGALAVGADTILSLSMSATCGA